MFRECAFSSFNISDKVTSIGGYVFKDCTSLTSVTIPNSVTAIYRNVFQNCTSLTSITFHNSLTNNLLNSVFADTTQLTTFYMINQGNTYYRTFLGTDTNKHTYINNFPNNILDWTAIKPSICLSFTKGNPLDNRYILGSGVGSTSLALRRHKMIQSGNCLIFNKMKKNTKIRRIFK